MPRKNPTARHRSPLAPRIVDSLAQCFDDCMSSDRARLLRLQQRLEVLPHSEAAQHQRLSSELEQACARSRALLQQRKGALPRPSFPPELPVSHQRETIAAALQAHQVVIVCGETGSGKTTQLPKICLELGRGAAGLIGHTQPRRVAARAIAARIAQELKTELGQAVGYKIRFSDRLGPDSVIKLMTDGILLAETQSDPLLSGYDTLILDEAHERSLNVDFLLGYLKTLLPQRPDLKLIVTSATLDAQGFARHFRCEGREVPVIEVSGRLYPIELRYRPVGESETVERRNGGKGETAGRRRKVVGPKLYEAIVDAVNEAQREGPGDVLVFLPGEREIREAAEALRKASHGSSYEILPLFARQSAQEQARVFSPSRQRRVVLATNVAETALTVPGICYVIDSGLARVKRYSFRNKVEQLLLEPIAQSAAKQRAGRCGRVMDGICFRLYEEQDFLQRAVHSDPEILRSSLAGVILRMKLLGLGELEQFPLIDPPLPRMINDGYQLLGELAALKDDAARSLTTIGRELARLPLDPKIGRMILAARERGCLAEVLVIAAALSVQDPRERNQDSPMAARQAHALFRGGEQDCHSEFLWFCHVWKAWCELQRHQSSAKQKAWCRQHFLAHLRMREWRDVHNQLRTLCAEHGWKENQQPASYEAIHKALLAGLLGHIGCRVEEAGRAQAGSYLGGRGIRFWPHPASPMARRAGKWIVVAELVETSQLFGRCVARIEPEWLEEVAAHLLRRQVYEPHWSKRAGAVRAWERATLYGLTLYGRRGVGYREIDPALCRELLIRHALVQGDIAETALARMPFLQHNLQLVEEIEHLEHKSRRPDVLVDETLIQAFYEARLPEDIVDLASLMAWCRQRDREQPHELFLSREQLMRHEAQGITSERFPAAFEVFGQTLELSYLHQPGAVDDGVTLSLPLAMINQIPAHRCEWLVPGLLQEKVLALLKTVPQKHRHRLQPLGESAASFCAVALSGEIDTEQALLKAIQQFVEQRVSLKLTLESIRSENLAPHFYMNFRVFDEHERMLGQSRSLAELRQRYGYQVAGSFSGQRLAVPPVAVTLPLNEDGSGQMQPQKLQKPPQAAGETMSGFTAWTFGRLPKLLEIRVAGYDVIGFPALHDDGASVSLRPFDTPEEAASVHRAGLVRLFALALKDQVRSIEKSAGLRDAALRYVGLGSEAELRAMLVAATLARVCLHPPLPVDAASFQQRCAEAKPKVVLVAQEYLRLSTSLLLEQSSLLKRLMNLKSFPQVVTDIQLQLQQLLPPAFLTSFPWERLAQFPRYLKAVAVRLDKLRNHPERDAQLQADWQLLAQAWIRERQARRYGGDEDEFLDNYRWLLEELRVGLYAQELRTPMPVSIKRLQKIWATRPR